MSNYAKYPLLNKELIVIIDQLTSFLFFLIIYFELKINNLIMYMLIYLIKLKGIIGIIKIFLKNLKICLNKYIRAIFNI